MAVYQGVTAFPVYKYSVDKNTKTERYKDVGGERRRRRCCEERPARRRGLIVDSAEGAAAGEDVQPPPPPHNRLVLTAGRITAASINVIAAPTPQARPGQGRWHY